MTLNTLLLKPLEFFLMAPAHSKPRCRNDNLDVDVAFEKLKPLLNVIEPKLDLGFSMYAKHKRSMGVDMIGLNHYVNVLTLFVELCPQGLPNFVELKALFLKIFQSYSHLIPTNNKKAKAKWTPYDFAHESANCLKNVLLKHLRDLAASYDSRKRPIPFKELDRLVKSLKTNIEDVYKEVVNTRGHLMLVDLMKEDSDDETAQPIADATDSDSGIEVEPLAVPLLDCDPGAALEPEHAEATTMDSDIEVISDGVPSDAEQFHLDGHTLLTLPTPTDGSDTDDAAHAEIIPSSPCPSKTSESPDSITFDWAAVDGQKQMALAVRGDLDGNTVAGEPKPSRKRMRGKQPGPDKKAAEAVKTGKKKAWDHTLPYLRAYMPSAPQTRGHTPAPQYMRTHTCICKAPPLLLYANTSQQHWFVDLRACTSQQARTVIGEYTLQAELTRQHILARKAGGGSGSTKAFKIAIHGSEEGAWAAAKKWCAEN